MSSALALELYDGPYYRIIRKLRREGQYPLNVDIYIMSAQYGIIRETDEIDWYDRKMSLSRAKELHLSNLQTLQGIMEGSIYSNIMINLGKNYMAGIKGYEELIPSHVNLVVCSGEIGMRMSRMRSWLLGLLQQQKEGRR